MVLKLNNNLFTMNGTDLKEFKTARSKKGQCYYFGKKSTTVI